MRPMLISAAPTLSGWALTLSGVALTLSGWVPTPVGAERRRGCGCRLLRMWWRPLSASGVMRIALR